MHFGEGAWWRPLFEDTQATLQLGVGCSHNACRFCTMYKKATFAVSPRDEIEADIEELARAYSWHAPQRVFLTGGDALGLPFEHLEWALSLMREKMPGIGSVGCFARVGDVKAKSDAELARLAELGVSDVSIGAESGYDPALAFMGKGHTAADVVEQCARLDAAGISYDLFYLAGIAGAGRWEDNVRATVDVFGRTAPKRIMIHTMTLFPGAPLAEDIESGAFTPAEEMDVLRELRMLNAELTNECMMLGAHYGNAAPYNAWLPRDREAVLAYFDQRIAMWDEGSLRRFRSGIKSM